MVFVPTVCLGWLVASNWLRIRRVRQSYQNLPEDVRQRILNSIHEAGCRASICSLLVATETKPSSLEHITRSRYGGQPYGEAGDDWPALGPEQPDPATFLIQVELDATFPRPWGGRLVVVFNRRDFELTARSYAAPSAERFIDLTGGVPEREWLLRQIRIPRQQFADDDSVEASFTGLLDYDPVVLLETIPALHQELIKFTRRPADLLAAILAPNHCGYGFEMSDIVQLGGKPVWLTEDLDGCVCELCGRSMRFLFQFGDLNGGPQLGNSGVCYVFGCDEHPEHPTAICQSG